MLCFHKRRGYVILKMFVPVHDVIARIGLHTKQKQKILLDIINKNQTK
jgi:hypothetical protein